MHILKLTFGNCNIWRIGSLRSPIGVPGVEFVGVVLAVGDGPSRFGESGDREVGDNEGTSKYHSLSVS